MGRKMKEGKEKTERQVEEEEKGNGEDRRGNMRQVMRKRNKKTEMKERR